MDSISQKTKMDLVKAVSMSIDLKLESLFAHSQLLWVWVHV